MKNEMRNQKIYLTFLLLSLTLVIGCSFDVNPAYAPANPPVVEKTQFQSASLVGEYQVIGNPTLFFWPIDRLDEASQQYVPLSFEEKVLSRMRITRLSEEVEFYSAQIEPLEIELKNKYEVEQKQLEATFTQSLCYSYCDPDDFLCDPTDSTVLMVDEWMVSDDQAVQETILTCQENQNQRVAIKKLWDNEKQEKIIPIQQKAGASALALLQTIGDRNYIADLSQFSFKVDPDNKNLIEIDITYAGRSFSNIKNQSDFLIEVLNFDFNNGFLTIQMPWLNSQDNNAIIGQMTFDLEMVFLNKLLRVDGDFKTESLEGEIKIGRFSSKGQIKPL